MGRMSDLVIDIEELLNKNMASEQVSQVLNIPVEWVEAVAVTYDGEEISDEEF